MFLLNVSVWKVQVGVESEKNCILGENTALTLFWEINGPETRTVAAVEVDDRPGVEFPDRIEPENSFDPPYKLPLRTSV